jgi:CheY-like chemotaxis protein
MPSAEYACLFLRLPRERLAAAERLVRALPSYLAGAGECDLHHCASSSYLAAVLRAAPATFTAAAVARLGFWSARLGARGFLVAALSGADGARFRAELNLCERVVRATPLDRLPAVAATFFRDVAGRAHRPPPAGPPVLGVDLDGPGGEGARYEPESRALFVAGALAPPRGDQLTVSVRDRKAQAPVEGWATVVHVRGRDEAAPGRPAGFTLRVEGPAALHELLARRARERPAQEVRAAPRFPVKAPVTVTAVSPPPAAAAARPAGPPRPPPRARVEYASEQELAADWVENLSQGGAFVRTPMPLPEGFDVVLELALPDGARLETKGVVAFVNTKGMGVRFVLTPEQDALLAAAIARISARPRRALLVDDDALVRMMLSDALAARGFEVLLAEDGEAGLHTLSEELLALDLLVTDVRMPGMDGEAFIRTIRKAGGEAELAIVAMSGRIEPGDEEKLEAAGADAVLDKALGPELVAQAADATLERKRMGQEKGAA